MRYFSPTLWRDAKFPAVREKVQAANLEDLFLAYCVLSSITVFAALWTPRFKYAHHVFVYLHLVFNLCLQYAIYLSMIDVASETVLTRAISLLQFTMFNYVAAIWVQHCALDFPILQPLTEEEKKTASRWKRFRHSSFFLNRFSLGFGRWHTYIGTDSWRVALLWRLSVIFFFSLAVLGSGIGFTNPAVITYGSVFGLAGLATLYFKKEPTKAEPAVTSEITVIDAKSLPECEKLLNGEMQV